MKPGRLLFSISCLSLFCLDCFAQVKDSIPVTANAATYGPDDDFNLFLLFFGMTVISFMMGVAIIGAGLAILLLTVAAAFIGTGVLSVAVLVGLLKKSLSAGVKTLLYSTCSLIGAAAGTFGFWMIAKLFHLELSSATTLLGGLLAGLLGGILWARICIFLLGKAKKYFERILLSDQGR